MRTVMQIPTPSWLLLFWCGLAAAIVSEWVAAIPRIPNRRNESGGRAGTPRLLSQPHGSVPLAILYGTLIFAPAYGLLFEWLARADLEAGAVAGAVHGALAALLFLIGWARMRRNREAPAFKPVALYRARRLLARVVYGAVLGFLYVVPTP